MRNKYISQIVTASALALGLSGAAIAAGSQSPTLAQSNQQPSTLPSDQIPQSQSQPGLPSAAPEDQERNVGKAMSSSDGISIIGLAVRNGEGEKLGEIESALLTEDGQATDLVLQTGGLLGMGTDHYKIPWSQVQLSPDGSYLIVNTSKDQLESEFSAFEPKPAVETKPEPSRDQPAMTPPLRGTPGVGATGTPGQ